MPDVMVPEPQVSHGSLLHVSAPPQPCLSPITSGVTYPSLHLSLPLAGHPLILVMLICSHLYPWHLAWYLGHGRCLTQVC